MAKKRCKLCPYKKTCSDVCYGSQPCDFALAFDSLERRIVLWKGKARAAQKPFLSRRVYGDYVLVPMENEFNDKISWWLSKKGYTIARYCFTAPASGPDLDFQLMHIDQYIKDFEEGLK